MSNNQQIACDPSAIEGAEKEKHKKNGKILFEAVEDTVELFNGYAFLLPAETDIIEKAGAVVARERLCCPFIEFKLEVKPEEGSVWLKFVGNKEVKKYVKQNLVTQLESGEYYE